MNSRLISKEKAITKFSFKWAILALLFFLVFFQYFDKQVQLQPGLGTDEIYLYTLALHSNDPGLVDGYLGKVEDFQKSANADVAEIESFALRANFAKNYFLPSLLMGSTFRVFDRFLSHGSLSYPELFSRKLNVGIVVWYSLAVLLLIALLAASSGEATAACVSAILAVFVLNALAPVVEQYRIASWSPLLPALKQMGVLFLSDKSLFAIFGHTPRSYMFLLLIGVAALRLSSRYKAAYWVLFGLSLVHFVYALLAMALFVAIDLVVRPSAALKPGVKAPILATLTSSFFFGGSLDHFIDGNTYVIVGTLIGVALFLWPRGTDLLVRWQEKHIAPLLPDGRGVMEIALMVAALSGAIAISMLGAEFADFRSNKYFFQELPGRLIGILRPVFAVYACYVVLCFVRRRSAALHRVSVHVLLPVTVSMLCLARIYVTAAAPYSVFGVPGVAKDADRQTAAFQSGERPAQRVGLLRQGVLVYYAINKEVETGEPVVDATLSAIYGDRGAETRAAPRAGAGFAPL